MILAVNEPAAAHHVSMAQRNTARTLLVPVNRSTEVTLKSEPVCVCVCEGPPADSPDTPEQQINQVFCVMHRLLLLFNTA